MNLSTKFGDLTLKVEIVPFCLKHMNSFICVQVEVNTAWKQHLTKKQLYSNLVTFYFKMHPSNTEKICRALLEKQELTHKWLFSYGLEHVETLVVVDQQRLTDISSVWTLDVVWKIGQKRWITGTDSEECSVMIIYIFFLLVQREKSKYFKINKPARYFKFDTLNCILK